MVTFRRRSVVVLAAAPLLLAACGGAADSASSTSPTATSASTSASPSNPYGAPTVDPPGPNDPVLVVTGGSAGTVSLTLAQLNALGQETVSIDEPFVKKRQDFGGVPMSAVLEKAGIPGSATITTKALNGYEYANTASAFTDSKALIATSRDGAPIPYDQGGPIRIVFPDGTSLSSVLDAWNWSLAEISATKA